MSVEQQSTSCPIGSLRLHTWNYEGDECIWCGPNRLAGQPGRWVSNGDGTDAWSVQGGTTEQEQQQ